MKTALVCGAGGFIGGHLVKKLKAEGFWVRGVDLKNPEFSKTAADEFVIGDLRDQSVCQKILINRLTKFISSPRIWAALGIFLPGSTMPTLCIIPGR